MKASSSMPRLYQFILHPLTGKVFLSLLASSYVFYLVIYTGILPTLLFNSATSISEHPVQTTSNDVFSYWAPVSMSNAINTDELLNSTLNDSPSVTDLSAVKAAKQKGQLPQNKSIEYPLDRRESLFYDKLGSKLYVFWYSGYK